MSRLTRFTGWVLVLVVVVGAALAITGGVTVVSTHGNSMEPGFHAGDLALVTPSSDYDVGDVAAYRSDELDTVVLHRIVGRDGDRLVLRGDNNSWLDPERPSPEQMVGTLALHVPRGGLWLGRLTAPPALALYAFGLVVAGGATHTVRRRGKVRHVPSTPARPRRAAVPSRPPAWSRLRVGQVATAAAVLAFLGGSLVLVATTRPGRAPGPVEYEQQATFAYAADAPVGPVYPDGEVRTGDTVFVRVVDRLDVTVDWTLTSPPEHGTPDLSGSADLTLVLADGSGWRRSVPIDADVTVDGPTATLSGQVDLERLKAMVASAQANTGTSGGAQTLTLVADVDTTGQVAGQPVSSEFRPSVTLDFDALRLRPATAGEATDDPFRVSQTERVTVPGVRAATIGLAGRDLRLATVRALGTALAGLALVLAVVATVLRRVRPSTEEQQIRARYGHLIIDVHGMSAAEGRTRAEVATMEGLVGVAERLQLPILSVPLQDGSRLYTVDDLQTQYGYRVRPTTTVDAT